MDREPRGPVEQSVLPLSDGKIRVSCTWKDDPELIEMIEEYQFDSKPRDTGRSSVLLMRKWRKADKLKGPSPWCVEVGVSSLNSGGKLAVSESSSNPAWCPCDESDYWAFHVTNIPYPIDVYSVEVFI